VNEDHFRLDKLLNRTEQDLQELEKKEKQLQSLIKENEKLQIELNRIMHKEKHQQQVDVLKHQNKIAEEKLVYLKEMERKLKQIVIDWKKEEDKNKAIKNISALLFNKNQHKASGKMQKKIESKYDEIKGEIVIGVKVKMKLNHQVGEVLDIRGKKAVVKIGLLPMQVDIKDLVLVKEKPFAGKEK
jgi:DNA mismatch repair protein MutS2